MRFKHKFFVPAFAILLFVGASIPNYLNNNNPEKERLLIQAIVEGLSELHFQPQKVNDDFSIRIYDLYMKRLDNGKRFFTKSDIKKLEKYKTYLDDQATRGKFDFFDLSLELYDKRKEQIREVYKSLLANPFDFTKKETLETSPDKVNYPKNEKALMELWRKSLKYQTMTRLADLLEEQKKDLASGDKDLVQKSYTELEKEARAKVLKSHNNWFQRLDRLERKDRLSMYINCVTSAYDPHTGYFPPQDKENFDISMSGRLEGIGARLQEEGKYTKVVSIVPGSPSYQQGELEVGDKIVAVAQGKGEPVDAVDMRIDDVVKMIRGKKGTEVRLTVKKRDNTKVIIPIIRDVIILEESYAKSAILEDDAQKIGYIHLPKFYTDFRREGGRRCATDVKAELTKLKAENVKGVILDLRNNGGGSLQDVVEMSGLFIDSGPIVQVKARNRKARVLKDEDPNIHYEGPLVIMVNAFSASASEIMAAALQDYGRAIIVGSSSTFGKGTVQQFIDLDRMVPNYYNELKPLGAVKLTVQKFYRIDGSTTQLKGVTPDIIIPDDYTYIEVGEKEEDFAMGWDEIPAARYSSTNFLSRLDAIQLASNTRIASNEAFSVITKNARRLKERRDKSLYSLNLKDYQHEQAELEAEAKALEGLEKEIKGLSVKMPKADVASIEKSESKKARVEEWHKGIKKDLQLKETLAIMKDMLQ